MEMTIEVAGVRIYYESHGLGEPLLLLHAGSLTGDMWQPYLPAFAEHYRVIVPDMPGHGRSGNLSGTMSYRRLADVMAGFARVLELHRPQIVGFSDGGQVALEIGMRYPALAKALAIGGVCFKDSDAVRRFVRSALGDEASTDVDTTLLARNHPDWAAWLDQIYGPGKWKPILVRLKPMWTSPLNYTAEDFSAVVAPTLVMIGDRDELVPVEDAAEMYRFLKKAELAVVPDTDHGGFFAAKVPIFQSVIVDFLRRSASPLPKSDG